MGQIRNGARTFLELTAKICKLSRLPGFRVGMRQILGAETADPILAAFDPFCALVDAAIATDNYFNQVDRQNDDGTGEDPAGA